MKKNEIKVTKSEGKIIIKARHIDILLFIPVFVILLYFAFNTHLLIPEGSYRNLILTLIVLLLLFLVVLYIRILFRRIIIDKYKSEILIYDHQGLKMARFDEIKSLESICKNELGNQVNMLTVHFTNGKKYEIETATKEQSDELTEIINSFIKQKETTK